MIDLRLDIHPSGCYKQRDAGIKVCADRISAPSDLATSQEENSLGDDGYVLTTKRHLR